MPTRDNLANQRTLLVFNAEITSDTTTVSTAIIDTADYDMGIFFSCGIVDFTDGEYELVIQESDDPAMSGQNLVAAANLLPTIKAGVLPTLDALNVLGAQLSEFGIVGTKRFVRLSVISTGTTSGARVIATAIQKGEYNPQDRV